MGDMNNITVVWPGGSHPTCRIKVGLSASTTWKLTNTYLVGG